MQGPGDGEQVQARRLALELLLTPDPVFPAGGPTASQASGQPVQGQLGTTESGHQHPELSLRRPAGRHYSPRLVLLLSDHPVFVREKFSLGPGSLPSQ